MIRGEWRSARLGDYCDKIGSGATPRGGETVYEEHGVSLIRSQNVHNGRFVIDGLAHISEKHAQQLNGVTVEPGDILLNITGDSVARSCRVLDSVLPARVNQHVAIVRPKLEAFDARFVSYYLISPFMQETMLSLAGSGGTRKALTKEMIQRFEVPCPPRFVQERISDILSSYDDLIENSRRRIMLLEKAARLLYREWFVHFRFPGHEHLPAINGIPEGWRGAQLGDLCTLQRGYDLPTISRNEGTIPVISSSGPSGVHNEKKADGPGIVTGRYGTIGSVYYVEGPYWPLNTALYVRDFKDSPPLYLFHALELALSKVQSGTGAVPGLNRNVLHTLPVTRPSDSLRDQFEEFASANYRAISVLREAIIKLQTARDLLLPRLMSSEISV